MKWKANNIEHNKPKVDTLKKLSKLIGFFFF